MTVTATITMPDGRVGTLTGKDREAVMAKAMELKASMGKAPASATESGVRGAATSFMDNLLSIPKIPRRILDNSVESTMAPDKADEFRAAQQTAERFVPDLMPKGKNIVAGVTSLLDGLGGSSYADEQARGEEARVNHPTATQVGEIAGDAITMATGRMPFAGGLKHMEKVFNKKTLSFLDNDKAFKRVWNRVIKSDFMKDVLKRPGYRAAETGLEGYTLALMKDGDPMDTAMYSAGFQLAGSGAIGFANQLFDPVPGVKLKPGARLALALAVSGGVFAVAQNFTGSGEGNIFDRLEADATAIDKASWALGLGLIAGLAGTGRVRTKDYGEITDALTALPRNAIVSLLEDVTNEKAAGGSDVQDVVAHFLTNPGVFNKKQTAQLEEGMINGRFAETVENLIQTDAQVAKILLEDPVPVQQEQAAAPPLQLDPMLTGKNEPWHDLNVPADVGGQRQEVPAGAAAASMRRRFEGLDRLQRSFP